MSTPGDLSLCSVCFECKSAGVMLSCLHFACAECAQDLFAVENPACRHCHERLQPGDGWAIDGAAQAGPDACDAHGRPALLFCATCTVLCCEACPCVPAGHAVNVFNLSGIVAELHSLANEHMLNDNVRWHTASLQRVRTILQRHRDAFHKDLQAQFESALLSTLTEEFRRLQGSGALAPYLETLAQATQAVPPQTRYVCKSVEPHSNGESTLVETATWRLWQHLACLRAEFDFAYDADQKSIDLELSVAQHLADACAEWHSHVLRVTPEIDTPDRRVLKQVGDFVGDEACMPRSSDRDSGPICEPRRLVLLLHRGIQLAHEIAARRVPVNQSRFLVIRRLYAMNMRVGLDQAFLDARVGRRFLLRSDLVSEYHGRAMTALVHVDPRADSVVELLTGELGFVVPEVGLAIHDADTFVHLRTLSCPGTHCAAVDAMGDVWLCHAWGVSSFSPAGERRVHIPRMHCTDNMAAELIVSLTGVVVVRLSDNTLQGYAAATGQHLWTNVTAAQRFTDAGPARCGCIKLISKGRFACGPFVGEAQSAYYVDTGVEDDMYDQDAISRSTFVGNFVGVRAPYYISGMTMLRRPWESRNAWCEQFLVFEEPDGEEPTLCAGAQGVRQPLVTHTGAVFYLRSGVGDDDDDGGRGPTVKMYLAAM